MENRKKILLDRILVDDSEMFEFLNYCINFFIEDDKKTAKLEESGVVMVEFLDSYIDFAWNSLKVYLSKNVVDWMSWFVYELNYEQQNGLVDTSHLATYADGRPIFTNKEEFIRFLIQSQKEDSVFEIKLIQKQDSKETKKDEASKDEIDLMKAFMEIFGCVFNPSGPENSIDDEYSDEDETEDKMSENNISTKIINEVSDFFDKCNIENKTLNNIKDKNISVSRKNINVKYNSK